MARFFIRGESKILICLRDIRSLKAIRLGRVASTAKSL